MTPRVVEVGIETGAELGTVVGEYAGDVDAEATKFGDHTVEEPGRDLGVRWAEEHFADRPSSRGVDRGELPHRPDTFEVPDIEAVQRDQVTRPGREVTEPERALPGIVSDETGRRCGQLCECPDALTTPTEAMTTEDLLDPTRRDLNPAGRTARRRNDELPMSDALRLRRELVDHPRRGLVRHRRRSTPLGHQGLEHHRLSTRCCHR